MERYINADEAIHELTKLFMPNDYPKIVRAISRTRTGDVRLEIHAHWEIVYDEDCDGGGKYICGNCRHSFSFGAYFELCRFDYCPNCGAVMDERGEEE